MEITAEQIKKARSSHLDRDLDYYIEKFQRRVYRRMLEYETLRIHIRSDAETIGKDLVLLLNLDRKVVQEIEIKDHLEKICLIGLKAEFELFFMIYTKKVLNCILNLIKEKGCIPNQHKEILQALKDHRKYIKSFFESGMKDPSTTFIEHVMPSHGLERMIELLENKCGWRALKRLETMDQDFMPAGLAEYVDGPMLQVRMAFQVRHAVEHSFSLVGQRFLHKTKGLYEKTTWRRHFKEQGGPPLGARISIDPVDIKATAASMTAVVRELSAHWKEFTPQS